jgi:squalene-hopene/tetraprenyl-beta-curcumene cyclase
MKPQDTHEPPSELWVETAMESAQKWLLSRQRADGHWVAELEGDTILESEYILLLEFLGMHDDARIPKLLNFIRSKQLPSGGWAIFPGGPPEVSASVKNYFVLKLHGHSPDAPYMQKAREEILRMGGTSYCNTFTKIYLSMFGQYEWDCVPVIPPELIQTPRWLYFSLYEMSSWSRTMIIPLALIWAHRPVKKVPDSARIDELFLGPRTKRNMRLPRDEKWITWRNWFLFANDVVQFAEKCGVFRWTRKSGIEDCEKWMIARFEKTGGLGAIFPAMVNATMALHCLGYKNDDPLVQSQLKELEALQISDDEKMWLQPCVSPVWDTALTTIALYESGVSPSHPAMIRAGKWMLDKEVQQPGDWAYKHKQRDRDVKQVGPQGAWFFEYANEFYPDVDDTIMVMMALRRVQFADDKSVPPLGNARDQALQRGLHWVLGMQCTNGGWAAFDVDNDKWLFTQVPFADHNAMIDPPTSDITGRVLECLGHFGYDKTYPAVQRAIAFIKKDQCADGSWIGRWGCNYIYGTWQVLKGLWCIGEDMNAPYVQKAVAWLRSIQNPDGGWGETLASYDKPELKGKGVSTASQTAWALMGLMSAGDLDSDAVRRGVNYLLHTQNADGTWSDETWTGTGFPKVFYLKYHYYQNYFPLWALSSYIKLRRDPAKRAEFEPPFGKSGKVEFEEKLSASLYRNIVLQPRSRIATLRDRRQRGADQN